MESREHYLALTARVAEDVVPVANAKMAACIVLRGKVISFGVNEMKSHPLQKKYSRNEHKIYKHAEISAIVNAMKRVGSNELKDATMYVARVKRPHSGSTQWVPGRAKPCPSCEDCIRAFGIGEVVYTQ